MNIRKTIAILALTPLLITAATRADSVTGDHCEMVDLTISRSLPPAWAAEAHLDAKGRWFVTDWAALAHVSELSRAPFATPGMAECLAQWLLDHRGGPYFTDHPDFSCQLSLTTMIDDPAVRACQPRVVCDPGDTCS